MWQFRILFNILMVAAMYSWLGAAATAQDNQAEEQQRAQAKAELRKLTANLQYKKGSEVAALRKVDLKVEEKAVGAVSKGETLTVENVKDNWLWASHGELHGWIDRRDVITADLLAWYKRLSDNASVEEDFGRCRAKYDGVLFGMAGTGQADPSFGNFFQDVNFNGVSIPGPFTGVTCGNMAILIRKRGERRELSIYLTAGQLLSGPFNGLFEAASRAKSYGMVEQGDYVTIDAKARQIFVNGERRKPQ
jgi:type II secretory pathway pseudopilin PulG